MDPRQDKLPDSSSREDFLKYACDITLDPNTANRRLHLSHGNRKATFLPEEQSYPDHPDRFFYPEVLSAEALTGRCYWEVECDGMFISIAASYKDIKRHGLDSGFGSNDKSWALRGEENSSLFVFNGVKSELSGRLPPRVGVYLDHSAGVLSFYSVQDRTMSLLHTVQTSFTQPLFAGLWIYDFGDSAHFVKLK